MLLRGMVGPVRQHNIMSSSLSVCGMKGTSWNKSMHKDFTTMTSISKILIDKFYSPAMLRVSRLGNPSPSCLNL